MQPKRTAAAQAAEPPAFAPWRPKSFRAPHLHGTPPRPRRRHQPSLFELAQVDRASFLMRLEARQVARELAHEVAARDPYRQAHALFGGGALDAQRDAKAVRVGVGDLDPVGDARAQRATRRRRALKQMWLCHFA